MNLSCNVYDRHLTESLALFTQTLTTHYVPSCTHEAHSHVLKCTYTNVLLCDLHKGAGLNGHATVFFTHDGGIPLSLPRGHYCAHIHKE